MLSRAVMSAVRSGDLRVVEGNRRVTSVTLVQRCGRMGETEKHERRQGGGSR